jgi:DNA-binding beta-propeller fold protein YncE
MVGGLAKTIAAAGSYRLVQTVPVGGAGVVTPSGTVDPLGRRLYVTHNTQVEILDVDSGTLVGKIEKTPGVRAVAVAPELGRGFVTHGQASVTIFSLKTHEAIGEVKVTGAAPTQLAYDPETKRIFTLNRRGYSVTAVDAQQGTVAGTIDFDSRPEFAVADANGRLFVSLWEKEAIVAVDSRTLTPVGQPWVPRPCQRPTSVAIDRDNRRLFVGCSNRMMVVLNAGNGRLITRVPTSQGRSVVAAFDPQDSVIFSVNGEGTSGEGVVTVLQQDSADRYRVLQSLKVGAGARAMAFDPKTRRMFVPFADQSPQMGVGGNDIRYVPDSFRILVFGA